MRRLLAALALAAVGLLPTFVGTETAHAKANLTTVSTIGSGGGAAVVATANQPIPHFTPVVKIVKTVKKKSSPKPIIIRDIVVEEQVRKRKELAEETAREAKEAKRAEAKAATESRKKYTGTQSQFYKQKKTVETKREETKAPTGTRGPSSSYNWATPGQCTWGALQKWKQATGWYLGGFHGNAETWGYRAANAGHRVGTTPRARSVVVMQAGVHGSGSVGHVAWVTNVSGNKVTYIEMNGLAGPYNWSTRTVSHQGGMQYIYAP